MPIHEYQCQSCDWVFARLRSISAASDVVACPHCGSEETRRLVSTFAAGSTSSEANCPAVGAPCPGGGGGGG